MRPTPIPLVAAALLLGLWVLTARSGSVPGAMCEADFRELIAEIERNRENSIAEINAQLAEAPPENREPLLAMREHAWDDEEQQRAQATLIRRDCMRAAHGKG